MSETQRYARVPAEMSRAGWQRTAQHVATAGTVTGRAASVAGALDSLGAALSAMAGRAHAEPSVWWDAANSQLWIAVPDAVSGGHCAYPVKFAAGTPCPVWSLGTSAGSAPAAEAFVTAEGMQRVPRGR